MKNTHTRAREPYLYIEFSCLRVYRGNDGINILWCRYNDTQHRWSAHAYDLRSYAEHHDVSDPPATVPIGFVNSHNAIAVDHVMILYTI